MDTVAVKNDILKVKNKSISRFNVTDSMLSCLKITLHFGRHMNGLSEYRSRVHNMTKQRCTRDTVINTHLLLQKSYNKHI